MFNVIDAVRKLFVALEALSKDDELDQLICKLAPPDAPRGLMGTPLSTAGRPEMGAITSAIGKLGSAAIEAYNPPPQARAGSPREYFIRRALNDLGEMYYYATGLEP